MFQFQSVVSNWIDQLIEEDPDVVILTDIEGISAFVELGKKKEWTPRAVLVTESAGMRCKQNSVHRL